MDIRKPKTLIVSPHPDVIEKVRRSLDAAGVGREPDIWEELPSLSELRRRLREAADSYSAAIFDMSQEHEALRLVAAMRDSNPSTVTIVVNGERRLGAVVRAKQAGAWGYLTEPYDLNPLAERLGLSERDEAELSPQRSVGRLVAFLPAQGGAGASTIALNAAVAASRRLPGEVLLIDYDFHCGVTAFQLQVQPVRTIADAFRGEPAKVSWDDIAASWEGLRVLVGPKDPAEISGRDLSKAQALLESAKRRYASVFMDLPAPLLTSSAQALNAADRIYVVCTPEITSLHLAKRLTERIRRLGAPGEKMRLMVNRVGSWGGLDTEQIRKVVGLEVDWALDNDYAAVRKATWNGGPIGEGCALREQIEQLASQFLLEFQLEGRQTHPRRAEQPANAF